MGSGEGRRKPGQRALRVVIDATAHGDRLREDPQINAGMGSNDRAAPGSLVRAAGPAAAR